MADPAAVLTILLRADTGRASRELAKFDQRVRAAGSSAQKSSVQFDSTTHSINRSGREADRSSHGFSKLGRSIVTTNQAAALFGKSVKLLKGTALLAALGPAAEGVSALAGGVVALSGALVPAIGLATQYGTVLGTLGQVKAVLALSGLKDVTSAVGSLTSKIDKQSVYWKRLSPEAQKFAETLDKFQSGPLSRVQKAVQRPLFGAFTRSMKDARKAVPAFRDVLSGTARALGNVTERMAKFIGSKAFASDFRKVGGENNKVLQRMGVIGVNLAKALMDILVAARPLTEWISKGVKAWSEWLAKTTQAGRESGALAHFFGETKNVTGDLISLIKDLGMALLNIMKLGQPLGNEILDRLVKAAHSFREWTESAGGKNTIKDYFKAIRPPLFEAGRLLHDITIDLFKFSKGRSTLTPLLRTIRTDLLPLFVQLAKQTAQTFGPKLLELIKQVGILFATAVKGSSGPLNIWVDAMTQVVKLLNWMIKNVPGFQTVLTTLLGFKALSSVFKFSAAITGAKMLYGWLMKLAGVEAGSGLLGGLLGGKLGRKGAGAGGALTTVEENALFGGGAGALTSSSRLAKFTRLAGPIGLAITAGIVIGITTRPLMDKLHDVISHAADSLPGPLKDIGNAVADSTNKGLIDIVGGFFGGGQSPLDKLKDELKRVQDIGRISPSKKSFILLLGKDAGLTRKQMKHLRDELQKLQEMPIGGGPKDWINHMRQLRLVSANASKAVVKTMLDMVLAQKQSGDITQKQAKKMGNAILNASNSSKAARVVWNAELDNMRKHTQSSFQDTAEQARRGSGKAADVVKSNGRRLDKDWSDHTANVKKHTRSDFQDTAEAARRGSGKAADVVDKNGRKLEKSAGKHTNEARKDATRNMGRMGMVVAGVVASMVDVVSGKGGFKTLQKNINNALTALGISKKVGFSITKAAKDAGKVLGAATGLGGILGQQKGGITPRAKGGILVGGTGSGDKVPALLEPGEVVWNREAVAKMLGGARRADRPNKMFPRFATGGLVQRLQGGGFAGMQPEIVALAKTMLQHFGGYMSSGLRAGDTGSFHSKGLAADIVPHDWKGASSYANRIGSQLLEGIYNPGSHGGTAVSWDSGSKVPPSFWGSSTWAQHLTHIHVATGKAIEGAVGAVKQLKRLMLKGPAGPITDAGQQALDAVREAGNRYLSKHSPSMMGGNVEVGPGAISRAEMRTLLKAHGMPNWTGWIAMAESALDPHAVSSAGARGLFQIMPFWGGGDRLFDPNYNVEKARHILDTQGLSAWDPSRNAGAIPEGWGPHQGQPFQWGGVVGNFRDYVRILEDLEKGRLHFEMPPHPEGLTRQFINKVKATGIPEHAMKKLQKLDEKLSLDEDYAGRAAELTDFKSEFWHAKLEPALNAAVETLADNPEWLKADTGQKQLDLLKGALFDQLSPQAKQALSYMDAQGFILPEKFQQMTEFDWLKDRLKLMLEFRNRLVNAVNILNDYREKFKKWIRQAERKLESLRNAIDRRQTRIGNVEERLNKLNEKLGLDKGTFDPKTKVERPKNMTQGDFHDLYHRWFVLASLHQDLTNQQKWDTDERKQIGKIKPALASWVGNMTSRFATTGGGSYATDYWSALGSIDPHSNLRHQKGVPALGKIGGDFMELQRSVMSWPLNLEALFDTASTLGVGDTSGITDDNTSELLELTRQLLLEAQQRNIVLSSQMPVFQGMFARGGILGAGQWGIAGERGPEPVVGPARVIPAESAYAHANEHAAFMQPEFHFHFANGMEWLKNFVSVEVRNGQQGNVSSARRRIAARVH